MARRLPARIVDLVNRPWDKAVVHLQDIINAILDWLNDSWGGVQATKKEIITFITNNPDSTFDLEGTTGDNLAKLTVGGSIAPAFPLTSANEVSTDNTKHFLTVKGTLPSSPSTFVEGIVETITSSGSASFAFTGRSTYLTTGYTGSSSNYGYYVNNTVAGTSAGLGIASGNQAIQGDSVSTTTGTNIGVFGTGRQGNQNAGVVGRANNDKNSATNIGVAGFATNAGTTPIIVAGHFELTSSNTPTFTSAALVADNAATTNPIARFRNNGVDQVLVGDGVPNDNSQHFLEVVGTLPASPSTAVDGVRTVVASAGSASFQQAAQYAALTDGYTGSSPTFAFITENTAAGTANNLFFGGAVQGNFGVAGIVFPTTTGLNIGAAGISEGGNISVGSLGRATTTKNSATNIGGLFFGRNAGTTPIEIGVYAGLNSSTPTFTSAALVADNAATTNPIARFRNNGVDQVLVGDGVPNDNSQHFLEVVGTLPSSPSTSVYGTLFQVAGAGSASQNQYAFAAFLDPGYTGSFGNAATYTSNGSAGTGTSLGAGNIGLFGESYATTTGTNEGVEGSAFGGNINAGVCGRAIGTKNSATNIGVVGFGRNSGTSPIQIGGYFGLHTTNPTFTSAAIVADNAAVDVPIFRGRDNGTDVWTIQDGGHVYAKMGTKTLTESTATAFVRISVAQGTSVAGCVKYDIQANDGTDYQSRSGTLQFNCVNKAGTETPGLSTPSTATEAFSESTGASTLTNSFDTATGTDTFDIRANAASSLTQTTLRINYTVEMWSNAVTTVTPL